MADLGWFFGWFFVPGILPLHSKGSWHASHGTQGEQKDNAKLEFLRGTLDVLILKSLLWGPLHGYAITNFIRQQSDDALMLEEGTLYPALWRLENKRLVEAEWGLSENKRKAKYYRLTTEGRERGHEIDPITALRNP